MVIWIVVVALMEAELKWLPLLMMQTLKFGALQLDLFSFILRFICVIYKTLI